MVQPPPPSSPPPAGADPTVVYIVSALLPILGIFVAALIGLMNRSTILRVRRDTEETAERGREVRERLEEEWARQHEHEANGAQPPGRRRGRRGKR